MMYPSGPKTEDWLGGLTSRLAVASITSQGTIGGLLVSGVVSIGFFARQNKSMNSTQIFTMIFLG